MSHSSIGDKNSFWVAGERFSVTCSSLNERGQGLFTNGQQILAIPGLLPGETAEIQIEYKRVHSPIFIASIQAISHPSPHRREPACAVYGECGGCTLQHMSYDQQLVWKQSLVQQALCDFLPDLNRVEPCVPSGHEGFLGRRHAKYIAACLTAKTRQPQTTKQKDTQLSLGSYKPGSHELVCMDECKVVYPLINDVQKFIAQQANLLGITSFDEKALTGQLRHVILREGNEQQLLVGLIFYQLPTEEILQKLLQQLTLYFPTIKGVCVYSNLDTGNAILPFGAHERVLFGKPYLWEQMDGYTYRTSLRSFVQANKEVATRMYKTVSSLLCLKTGDTVLDLYCGTGAMGFTTLIDRPVFSLVGIEENPYAYSDLLATVEQGPDFFKNSSFINQRVDHWVRIKTPLFEMAGEKLIVIVNPPRKGCESVVMDWLCNRQPKQIVYVSCFLDSLQRDLQILCKCGYQIASVIPFDLHPQTQHVETLVVLQSTSFS